MKIKIILLKQIESLEKLGVLIDGANETVKHEIKKKTEIGFLGARIATPASSLIQSVASSLMNALFGKGVMRAGKGQDGRFCSLLALHLMIKVISGKGATRVRRG